MAVGVRRGGVPCAVPYQLYPMRSRFRARCCPSNNILNTRPDGTARDLSTQFNMTIIARMLHIANTHRDGPRSPLH